MKNYYKEQALRLQEENRRLVQLNNELSRRRVMSGPSAGRLEQFNFRVREDVKDLVHQLAEDAGVPIAEWMEDAIEAHAQRQVQTMRKKVS